MSGSESSGQVKKYISGEIYHLEWENEHSKSPVVLGHPFASLALAQQAARIFVDHHGGVAAWEYGLYNPTIEFGRFFRGSEILTIRREDFIQISEDVETVFRSLSPPEITSGDGAKSSLTDFQRLQQDHDRLALVVDYVRRACRWPNSEAMVLGSIKRVVDEFDATIRRLEKRQRDSTG